MFSSVCIASICRLVSVVTSNVADPDSTWVNVGQCVWAIVEVNFAVISGELDRYDFQIIN